MQHFRKIVSVLALAFAGLAASLGAVSAEGYGAQKVVYHINGHGGDGDKAYLGALRNVQNHINAVGAENLDLRVVMHGNGVGLLARALENEALRTRVTELKGQGVTFNVCKNTLVGRNINYETDLFDVWPEDIVPSGVAEIAHLQGQGFAYVKP